MPEDSLLTNLRIIVYVMACPLLNLLISRNHGNTQVSLHTYLTFMFYVKRLASEYPAFSPSYFSVSAPSPSFLLDGEQPVIHHKQNLVWVQCFDRLETKYSLHPSSKVD